MKHQGHFETKAGDGLQNAEVIKNKGREWGQRWPGRWAWEVTKGRRWGDQ